MTSEPVNREQIFNQAAEVEDPEQRRRLLDQLCGGDAALRAEIEDLLSQDARLGDFLEPPRVNQTGLSGETVAIDPDDTLSGSTIGNYQIQEVIGRGGMGAVYLARQSQPIKRRVALKVIRGGLDSRNLLARFAAERQALALMNHPNIARILDVGTHDGQPWFAMELVQGPPITRYCDDNRLSIEDRLKLFVDVCSGVQHAHQKGIIHRDLKPSNILVAQVDGRPVPKVIDFGLAKALESTQQLTDESVHTQIGQIVGTLKYMSPEQATLDLIDIDTRTDIYSLGVVLYELLTGSTPLDDDTLSHKSVLEVLELIREEDPVKPSRRLSSSGDRATEITQQRRTDSGSLNRILLGDLDWVVTKALEKDRSRRYETADALADDVHRFLNNEPIKARPPSTAYRLKKFVRKNRGAVAAVTAVILVLLAGIAGTSWGMSEAIVARNAEKERADSEQRAREKAETATKEATAARALAQTRLVQIEKSNEDLYSIFKDLDIRDVREGIEPVEAILGQRLKAVSQRLTSGTIGDEVVLAKLQTGLGRALTSLGFWDDAIPILENSLALRENDPSTDIGEVMESTSSLSTAYSLDGQWEKAIELDQANLIRSQTSFGPDSDDSLIATISLAQNYLRQGKYESAIELMEPAYDLLLARHGPDHELTVNCGNHLATSFVEKAELNSALRILEAIAPHASSVFGAYHSDTLTVKQNLAATYQRMGRVDRALPIMEEVLEVRQKRLGREHPETIQAMINVALAFSEVGQLGESVNLLEQALKLARKKLGQDHSITLNAANFLVIAYKNTRRFEDSMALVKKTLQASDSSLPDDHPIKLALKSNLAMCHWSTGEFDLAIEQYEELLDILEAKQTRVHPDTLSVVANLGVNHKDAGRPKEAIPLLEEVYIASRRHAWLRSYRTDLLECYLEADDVEAARSMANELVEEARSEHPRGSLPLARILGALGNVFLNNQMFEDAEPLIRESLKANLKNRSSHWATYSLQALLGETLTGLGRFPEAEEQLLEAYKQLEIRKESIPDHAPPEIQLPATVRRLISLYSDWHQAAPDHAYDEHAAQWAEKLD